MPTKKLTDLFCRSAKPVDGKRTDFFDQVTTGLSLRVSPTGAKSFFLHYTRPGDGTRARLTLGKYSETEASDGITLAEAREKAKEAKGQVIGGIDPIAEKKAEEASQTVAEMVENYVSRHASTKRSGAAIARRLRKNVSELIGGVKLSDLHRRDLTKCIDAIKDRGAHVEANRVFEDLRAMVRWARGRGDLDENLTEGMKKPSEMKPRERVLSADEIASMWKALPGTDMWEGTRRVIQLCLVTGQRVGEVSGMALAELDLNKALWTIPAARSKNGQKHAVPLTLMAVNIIEEQIAFARALAKRKGRKASDFVFPAPGGKVALNGGAVAKAIRRNEKTFNLPAWTAHDLRRTAATHMGELGISPFIIGHVLNHISTTKATVTTAIYDRYKRDKEKREALSLWADRLVGIIAESAKIIPLREGGR